MLGCPQDLAVAHLLLRLRPLVRALRIAVAARETRAHQLRAAGAVSTAISRGHADWLLDQVAGIHGQGSAWAGTTVLNPDEELMETGLREQARACSAALPLDALRDELGLDVFELEVLVLCAAVEVDTDFERVLGYVHDDAARRFVSVELACVLTAASFREGVSRRATLGPFGRLRRLGLIVSVPRESVLREELRISASCMQALLGEPVDPRLLFRDPAEVAVEAPALVPADPAQVAKAAEGLVTARVEVVGIWGRPSFARNVVMAIASAGSLAIRRLIGDPVAAVDAATRLRTCVWIDVDTLGDAVPEALVGACRLARVPIFLTGSQPWRPTQLLADRRYVEVALVEPDRVARGLAWRAVLPEIDADHAERLATSYRFDAEELLAVARTARASADHLTNGHDVTVADALGPACRVVARKHGERHTTLVTPRRTIDDLVLAPDLYARVVDIVHYFRAMPRVMEDWGFARRVSGAGLKALFTGESGTGKTLAAEGIAHELGLPMLKVDLARVVSKWIGETEKNLDLVFAEARDSHAVLFFDEAEALFGARGDVRHGTDRYANLEVSYLLQRFEDHGGVVILATNLRDKIDPAFMRRFHVVVGFPRPGEKERRRIWQRVFTPATPLAGDLDVGLLARLDLTGAGIVGAAQVAALLAEREGARVSMKHVVRGLVRQYQRESRVLNAHELGPHAAFLAS